MCECELLLCVIVKLVCCVSLEKQVCPVCRVGGVGVGMRVDLSGAAGLTSFAFLDAGSESVEDAVVVGSGR